MGWISRYVSLPKAVALSIVAGSAVGATWIYKRYLKRKQSPPMFDYDEVLSEDFSDDADETEQETPPLVREVRRSVIGSNHGIQTPFGLRRIVYADYTASGRLLTFFEEFLQKHVYPCYANTHTETSGTGYATTQLREDARETIRRCVNGCEDDAVIFCGNGATGAIHLLVSSLNLRLPEAMGQRFDLIEQYIPSEQRPVVFVGPFEHHSNELLWRESICTVNVVGESADGTIDTVGLEKLLKEYRDVEKDERPKRRIFGSFSAASNVTGVLSNVEEVTELLHKYDAHSFWDYAAAAPYVKIDVHNKDAIFISPHKFIGGPGSPGLLIVKKSLMKNAIPTVPGGGTVQFVSPTEHKYLSEIEHREEGGTPNILGAIRAGLAFHLKEAVGVDEITKREEIFVRRAIAHWTENDNIEILGSATSKRLSIISVIVKFFDTGLQLHHDFAVSLLNDLFGVQARGGCSCAGPYGHRLLKISPELSCRLEDEIVHGYEGIKPGWIRVNFNYFISERDFSYILRALDLVASYGWLLLPDYTFCARTGRWHWKGGDCENSTSVLRLSYLSYDKNTGQLLSPSCGSELPERSLNQHIHDARKIFDKAWEKRTMEMKDSSLINRISSNVDTEFENLRWFACNKDIYSHMSRITREEEANDNVAT